MYMLAQTAQPMTKDNPSVNSDSVFNKEVGVMLVSMVRRLFGVSLSRKSAIQWTSKY